MPEFERFRNIALDRAEPTEYRDYQITYVADYPFMYQVKDKKGKDIGIGTFTTLERAKTGIDGYLNPPPKPVPVPDGAIEVTAGVVALAKQTKSK
jgi:hypothetical protein